MSDRAPDAVLEWAPRLPTHVALTLGRLQRGRLDPVHRIAEDRVVWRTVRTTMGPATLRITPGPGGLTAFGWGPGAAEAVDSAPLLLGSEDDPAGFAPSHPLLAEAHRRFPGLRIGATRDVLQALVQAVLEQRVEGVDAIAAWQRLVRELGEPAPGPAPTGMVVFPEGARWTALSDWQWRRAGVDARRARTIRSAAQVDASLQRLTDRDPKSRDAALRSLAGVGVWTSAEVRQRAFGDADALSVGDFHLAKIIGQTLAGTPFTDDQLVAYLEPYRPHRYRVARLISALGVEHLPRRAPRRTRMER